MDWRSNLSTFEAASRLEEGRMIPGRAESGGKAEEDEVQLHRFDSKCTPRIDSGHRVRNVQFEHKRRTLPSCVLSPNDPLYTEWSMLDSVLDREGKKAKSKVTGELLWQTSTFQPEVPWILAAFKLPFVYSQTRPGSRARWEEFMDLENTDKRFQQYVSGDDQSTFPSSNLIQCEQHTVSRALFVASNRLRRAVAFSNLDEMRIIGNGMRNLLDSLNILVDGEVSFRRSVVRDLEANIEQDYE